jgi:hypothetical protein
MVESRQSSGVWAYSALVSPVDHGLGFGRVTEQDAYGE